MQEIILVKYGEMALKGMNKRSFEDALAKNIKRRIKSLGKTEITRAQSTIYIKPLEESFDVDEAMEAIKAAGETPYVVGHCEAGEKGVRLC